METNNNPTNDPQPTSVAAQIARLDLFLVASAFLVAAFITLVTSKDPPLSSSQIWSFTLSITLLGTFMAVGHTFMNFWSWAFGKGQTLHTWLTPLIFWGFWAGEWYVFNNIWDWLKVGTPIIIPLVVFLLLFPFSIIREKCLKKDCKKEIGDKSKCKKG